MPEMLLYGILIVIGLAVRPLVVLTHILSHALTAIAITKQRTTIYLGTYGDQEKSAKISVGLLDIGKMCSIKSLQSCIRDTLDQQLRMI
jgi:hypothetical protein